MKTQYNNLWKIVAICGTVFIIGFSIYFWFYRSSSKPLEIKILDEQNIEIDSQSFTSDQLRVIATQYYKKGGRSVVISGGEKESNRVFWKIRSECSILPLLMVSHKGCLISVYTGILYTRWLPRSPHSPLKGKVVHIELEKDQMFLKRQREEETGEILAPGYSIKASDALLELKKLIQSEYTVLNVICESDSSFHDFLELAYIFHAAGGKHIFFALRL